MATEYICGGGSGMRPVNRTRKHFAALASRKGGVAMSLAEVLQKQEAEAKRLAEAQQRSVEAAIEVYQQRHEKDRESLLANEGFAISMQQAVSVAMLLGTLSQWTEAAGAFGVRLVGGVACASALGLAAAILAAQLRHEYRLWSVKGSASAGLGKADEANVRFRRTNRYLRAMRFAMWASTFAICGAATAILVGALVVAVRG